MAFVIKINTGSTPPASTDKTTLVQFETLRIKTSVSGRGSAVFTVLDTTGAYIPAQGAMVLISYSGTNLFGGVVTDTDLLAWPGSDTVATRVTVAGYGILLDRRQYVNATYTAQTLHTIVAAIRTSSLTNDETTINNLVATGPTITFSDATIMTVAECFNRLATVTGYLWWVDADRDIHFVAPSGRSAAWNLTDANPDALVDSIRVLSSAGLYRNSQYAGPPSNTTRNNTSAQSTEAAISGGSGIYWRNDTRAAATAAQAEALADGLLGYYDTMPQTVIYQTDTGGLELGTTQTINLTRYGINDSYLIESIDIAVRGDQIPRYTITAQLTLPQGHWSQFYRDLKAVTP